MHAHVGLARLDTDGRARPRRGTRRAIASFTRSVMKSRLFTGLRVRVGLDLEGAVGVEVVAPAHRLRALVDVVLLRVGKLRDAPQDAARDARMQVGGVDQVEGAGEAHAGVGGLRHPRAPSSASSSASAGARPRGQGAKNWWTALSCLTRMRGAAALISRGSSERLHHDQHHDRRRAAAAAPR